MNQKTDDPTDSNEPTDQPDDEPEAARDDETGRDAEDSVPDEADATPLEPAADGVERGAGFGTENVEREPFLDEPATAAPESPAAPPVSRVPALVAGFAVLLALAGLAGVGWLAWQDRDSGAESAANAERIGRLTAQLEGLSGEIGETRRGLGELRENLATLEDRRAETASEMESLRARVEALVERNESVAPRLADLENAVSSLQGISTGAREAWMLAEAEYYLQIANARLQLARSPEIALFALNYADERLRQLSDPGLTEVRQALSSEIQALESLERTDIEGVTLTLANLADRVDSLPLDERVSESPAEPETVDDERGGASRAWASVKRAFSGLVSVRRPDEDVRPLLSPEAARFLRANLALQFQSARLALLRGEPAVYRRSLEDAADWLRQYYDADSRAVRQAIGTIGEIRDRPVEESLPDISESLRLLRQYRSRRDLQAGSRAAGEPGR